MPQQPWTERALAVARVDLSPSHRRAAPWRVVLATVLSLAGSLGVDALLVVIGTRLFPATRGYIHFRFSDYARLTTIGVLIACAAWPITIKISPASRWLFFRMAILVTPVLWLPDLYLLVLGQPAEAVGVLMLMHLSIALVTYNLLVHLAPPRSEQGGWPGRGGDRAPAGAPSRPTLSPGLRTWPMAAGPRPPALSEESEARAVAAAGASGSGAPRRAALAMLLLVGLELALGVGALVLVPYGRGTVWVPRQGRGIYLVHAIVGGLLGLGALAVLYGTRLAERVVRIGMALGLAGIVVAAGGGLATVHHSTRLLGLGLMLLGSMLAGFGYLMPLVEPAAPEPGQPSPLQP